MIPTNHVAAPSVEPGVLRRLRTLDPLLVVTWSPWSLDVMTGLPVESPASPREDGLIEDPAFYLWRRSSTCSHHFFVNVLPVFDHRVCAALESDLGRFRRPEELWRLVEEAGSRARDKQLEEYRERHRDVVAANKSRIGDLVFEGKSGIRTPKVFSGTGGSRTSSAEREGILMDPREDGWELPESRDD